MYDNQKPKSTRKRTGGGQGIGEASSIPKAGAMGYSTSGDGSTGAFSGSSGKGGAGTSQMGVGKGSDFSMSGASQTDPKINKGHGRMRKGKNSLKIGPSSMRG